MIKDPAGFKKVLIYCTAFIWNLFNKGLVSLSKVMVEYKDEWWVGLFSLKIKLHRVKLFNENNTITTTG